MEKVVLYDELHHILGKAVCRWAGVPLPPEDSEKRIRQLTSLFDAAGAKSLAHVKAQVNRGALESWLSRLVTQVRNGQLDIPENSPIHVIAHFSDTQGQRYSPRIAAVELINILRPVIAVSVFIVQSIHALHQYPECRDKLLKDSGYAELFVNEVRRFYPFFPATVARVREDFTWQGFQFRKGTRTMLDLYGTNHDERIWDSPHAFRPERFVDSNTGLFQLIPQGGGDHDKTHRCPGEYLTIALMKQALNVMLKDIRYELPNQNLTIDRSRLPAIPVSRLVIQDVEVVAMNHALPASVMS
jgi:fatty-acid peroxygenase